MAVTRGESPLIGLFVGSTDSAWENTLIQGAAFEAQRSGARLVCFNSGTLRSHHGHESRRNALFTLADHGQLDALIFSGTLSHHVGHGEYGDFCRRWAPLPVVSLAIGVPGVPSVTLGNRQGMEALMDHLLDVHGYRRMAFLGGPEGQQEAEIRRAVFQEKLEARGVSPDPGWFVSGDFTRASGRRAAEELWARWSSDLEGIVAANDAMALGAQDFLESKGVRIPEAFFLTGFDDSDISRYQQPPLTTVGQSSSYLGREAVRVAVDLARGLPVPPETMVTTALVVRTSCGCAKPRPGSPAEACPEEAYDDLEAQLREQVLFRRRAEDLGARVLALGEALDTAFSLSVLLDTLDRSLPGLGVQGLWLSAFEEADRPVGASRLLLGPRSGTVGTSFPTGELVPGGLGALGSDPGLLVVEVLHSQNLLLGLAVFSMDLGSVKISGSLRSQIGGALQRTRLLEERRLAEDQLVLSGQMAALGSLVAGVAHEINTPLGVALSAASYLETMAREFLALPPGNRNPGAFAQNLEEAGALVVTNLTRAADLVHSFKQVAADQTSEVRRPFEVREYLEETILSLRPQWKHRPITVAIEGPLGLTADSYPGAVAQVATNLLVNALAHGFPGAAGGTIRIAVADEGEGVTLRFEDDGAGIAAENLPRIFDPFFTTARGRGGTGLGLHIVRNLVVRVLGGSVTCESTLGRGTRFDVVFPRTAPRRD